MKSTSLIAKVEILDQNSDDVAFTIDDNKMKLWDFNCHHCSDFGWWSTITNGDSTELKHLHISCDKLKAELVSMETQVRLLSTITCTSLVWCRWLLWLGLPLQAVKKAGHPTASQFVPAPDQGQLPLPTAETAVLGWGQRGLSPSTVGAPVQGYHPQEKNFNFICKFLLSGAFSARKLTPAKVQNTTHFHSSTG